MIMSSRSERKLASIFYLDTALVLKLRFEPNMTRPHCAVFEIRLTNFEERQPIF